MFCSYDAQSFCCHLQSDVFALCGSFNFTGYFVPLVSCKESSDLRQLAQTGSASKPKTYFSSESSLLHSSLLFCFPVTSCPSLHCKYILNSLEAQCFTKCLRCRFSLHLTSPLGTELAYSEKYFKSRLPFEAV